MINWEGLTEKEIARIEKNINYWDKDRQAQAITKLTNKRAEAIQKQLKKYYRASAESCISEFENTYNKILATQEDGKDITPADLYKLDKYWQMQGQLRHTLQKLGERKIALLTKQFELGFFDVYYGYSIPGLKAFNTIDTETVQHFLSSIWCADGKSWSDRIWGDTSELLDALNEQLILSVTTGKSTRELKQMLQDRFNVSYRQAETITRTELANIQTQAAKERYKSYGIEKVQIWADKDERQCELCGKLHKKEFLVGEAVPIPAHPRCRCCIVPVIE